jgi:hypothetical protein
MGLFTLARGIPATQAKKSHAKTQRVKTKGLGRKTELPLKKGKERKERRFLGIETI